MWAPHRRTSTPGASPSTGRPAMCSRYDGQHFLIGATMPLYNETQCAAMTWQNSAGQYFPTAPAAPPTTNTNSIGREQQVLRQACPQKGEMQKLQDVTWHDSPIIDNTGMQCQAKCTQGMKHRSEPGICATSCWWCARWMVRTTRQPLS